MKRSFENGTCAWWNGRDFKRRPCSKKLWVEKTSTSDLVLYKIPKSLKPTRGTNIRLYTAYSRGTDEAGNVQTYFERGQNVNRFKVKR